MITCISFENIFTISLPQFIGIIPIQTSSIHITVFIVHCNTGYTVQHDAVSMYFGNDNVNIIL